MQAEYTKYWLTIVENVQEQCDNWLSNIYIGTTL